MVDSFVDINGFLQGLFRDAFGWRRDWDFLNGTGAGEPTGIFGAGCEINGGPNSNARTTASHIRYEDVAWMMSKLLPQARRGAYWIVNAQAGVDLQSILAASPSAFAFQPNAVVTQSQYPSIYGTAANDFFLASTSGIIRRYNGTNLTAVTGLSDYGIYGLSPDGLLRWKHTTHDMVFAAPLVAPDGTVYVGSDDDKLYALTVADGSVRWYSSTDGEERLAFFPSADGNRWIAWTRSGYYDTSLDGESLLGWEVPRGEEVPADFFRVGLLRETYYRPDIVARVLFAASERGACEEADAALENPTVAQPLRKLLPPVVRVLEPKEQTAMNSREVTVRVMIRSPSGEPIQNVSRLIQGRHEQSRGIVREKETELAQLPPTATTAATTAATGAACCATRAPCWPTPSPAWWTGVASSRCRRCARRRYRPTFDKRCRAWCSAATRATRKSTPTGASPA